MAGKRLTYENIILYYCLHGNNNEGNMEKNLNTVLSNLLNTFEIISAAMKNYGNPLLQDYGITEMHCIEHIGKITHPNVTKISSSLHITRGGVSKIIKRLINKGAITPYHEESNKKEVYYRLTFLGQKVFDAHEQLHRVWNDKDQEFFKKFKQQDIAFVENFIEQYTQHLKQTLKEKMKC